MRLLLCLLPAACCLLSPAAAQDGRYLVELPREQRERFQNPPDYGGSCVQASLGMCGVAQNVPAAEWLLWNSPYGPKVLGGSDPNRVRDYCNARRIKAYNVSGPQSFAWVEWALRNGRPCAITWGSAHMITALGISNDGKQIAVCDNNSPARITWVNRAEFQRMHAGYGGGWVVILRTPPPPGPFRYVPWWQN